jgi:enoyl-CoA hydratase
MTAIRIEDDGAVRHLVLCRAAEFNTITPQLRDELGAALDNADHERSVRVVLIRAEGRAFCAGFGLDWSTSSQATNENVERVWDSIADLAMIGRFAETFAKLNTISKPTIAAVQGWCVAGGTDMILNADIIVVRLPASASVGNSRSDVDVDRPPRVGAGQALPVHRR